MKPLITITILLLFLTSCKKEEDKKEVETGLAISVQFGNKLSTGEIIYTSEPAVIEVWDTKGHNLTIKSEYDALAGYAYDNTDQKSVSANYQSSGSTYRVKLAPGKYLVFVMLTRTTGIGRLASSYKTFEVTNDGYVSANKKFSYNATSAAHEDWDAK